MENPLKRHIQEIRQLGRDARRSSPTGTTEREQRILVGVAIVFVGLTFLHYVETKHDQTHTPTKNPKFSDTTSMDRAPSHLYLQGAGSIPGLDLDLLRAAKRSIDFMSDGTLGETVCAGLTGASARGVAVRIYLGSLQQRIGKDDPSQPCVMELGRYGADVRFALKKPSLHYRAYLVDGTVLRFGLAGAIEGGFLRDEPTMVTSGLVSANHDFQGEFDQLWLQAANSEPR